MALNPITNLLRLLGGLCSPLFSAMPRGLNSTWRIITWSQKCNFVLRNSLVTMLKRKHGLVANVQGWESIFWVLISALLQTLCGFKLFLSLSMKRFKAHRAWCVRKFINVCKDVRRAQDKYAIKEGQRKPRWYDTKEMWV